MMELSKKHSINIKPVSDLRNYTKLLDEVKPDEPVFLTKNGRGKYAVVDIEEYERFQIGLELLELVQKAESGGRTSNEDFKKRFGI